MANLRKSWKEVFTENYNGTSDIAKEIGKGTEYLKAVLGNGQKADEEYKKRYEKFLGQDGKTYVKRKETDTE